MSFDLGVEKEAGAIENDGAIVHICDLNDMPMYHDDADGNEQPVTIKVAGAHSKKFREIEGKQRRRRLKPKDLTGARLHEDNTERVVHCTLEWQGFTSNGEVFPLTSENARELYDLCPWVLDQIVEAMSDHTRFFVSELSS